MNYGQALSSLKQIKFDEENGVNKKRLWNSAM